MTLEERARAYASGYGHGQRIPPKFVQAVNDLIELEKLVAFEAGAKSERAAVIAEVREKLKPLVNKARTLNTEIGMQRIDKRNCFIDMCNLIVDALDIEQILKECEGE